MDPPAELLAEVPDPDEPDGFSVFLFEDGHGAFPDPFFERRDLGIDAHILPDLLIDQALDPPDLLPTQSGKWVKSNLKRLSETSEPACLT